MTGLADQIAADPAAAAMWVAVIGYFGKFGFEQIWGDGKRKVADIDRRSAATEIVASEALSNTKRNEGLITSQNNLLAEFKRQYDALSQSVMSRGAIETLVDTAEERSRTLISEAKKDMQAQIVAADGRYERLFQEIKADMKVISSKMETNKDTIMNEIRSIGRRRAGDE